MRRVPIFHARRRGPTENPDPLTGAPSHRFVRSHVPYGCSVQIGGDMSAHWNWESGTNNGAYKVVGSQSGATKAMRPGEKRSYPPHIDVRVLSTYNPYAFYVRTFDNPGPEWFLPYGTVEQRTLQSTNRAVKMARARMSSVLGSIYAAGNCLVDWAEGFGDLVEIVGNSMCHSAGERNPWWEADTWEGMSYQIEFVIVRNRMDCCWHRFGKYVVTVDGVECARGDADGQPGFLWIPCNMRGSTVRLQLLDTDYLNLQYVGVEGNDPKPKSSPPSAPAGEKVAMAGARMSSELPGGFPAANCLVDSDAFGSMCHTVLEETPWWEASTADGRTYDITKVIVRNRADCIGTRPSAHACRGAGRSIRVVVGPIASGGRCERLTPRRTTHARVDRSVHGPLPGLRSEDRRQGVRDGRREREAGLLRNRLHRRCLLPGQHGAAAVPDGCQHVPEPAVHRRGGHAGAGRAREQARPNVDRDVERQAVLRLLSVFESAAVPGGELPRGQGDDARGAQRQHVRVQLAAEPVVAGEQRGRQDVQNHQGHRAQPRGLPRYVPTRPQRAWWAHLKREGHADTLDARTRARRSGLCTDRFRDFVLKVDGRECVRGNANGKQGYYEIDCTNAACCRGKTVRLQLLTRGNTYLNLQYIGVKGTP